MIKYTLQGEVVLENYEADVKQLRMDAPKTKVKRKMFFKRNHLWVSDAGHFHPQDQTFLALKFS
ncbi:MAG: hypothetical protein CVT85_08480 [Alphaproteobacteria bacterium HGW-Alphaproteobacteria-7]|nr:MAG: hypothetical protein CVT85_08480 [Alphaproteobacteria bacterium HGW-Alphaproteobacteria-7]